MVKPRLHRIGILRVVRTWTAPNSLVAEAPVLLHFAVQRAEEVSGDIVPEPIEVKDGTL